MGAGGGRSYSYSIVFGHLYLIYMYQKKIIGLSLLIFLQKKHVSRKENRTGILRHGVYDEKATFQLKSQLFRTEKVAFGLFSHPYFLLEFGLRNATLKDDFSDGSHSLCCFCESGAAWAVERGLQEQLD